MELELKQRKRAASDHASLSLLMPRAKKVRSSPLESPVDSSSSQEPASISPLSIRSSHDMPATATSLTAHSTSKRPKKYVCEYEGCEKAFDRPVRLQAHIRTHTNERPFICNEESCTKSFFKSEHLKAHVQNKHSNDATHVCRCVISTNENGEEFECGKAFTTSTRLRRHAAIHEKAEELTCWELGCGQVFRKMETLQRHIRQEHLHEKAYRCKKVLEEGEECGQTFSTSGQLKAHENREHAGMRYFCAICLPPDDATAIPQIGFPTYADYQLHLKTIHPPLCTVCNKICGSNRALTAHMEIEHSSLASRQERYRCDYPECGRGFTRKGNLNVHIQSVHVKKRRFICGATDLGDNDKCPGWDEANSCGSAFTTKASLENHVRTQHLDLPNLYHPRKTAKVKKEAEAWMDTVVPSLVYDGQPEFPHDVLSAEHSAISLLTGSSYADSRPIACWIFDCPMRFTRTHDLVQHIELAHGWNFDDVQEELFIREATTPGNLVSTGETGEAVHNEGIVEDGELIQPLSQALSSAHLISWESFMGSASDGMPHKRTPARSHDNMVLDPVLSGL